jgi:hypothetical protein
MTPSQTNANLLLVSILAALVSNATCGWRPCLAADIMNHRYSVSDISLQAIKDLGYFSSKQWKNEDGKPIQMFVSKNYEMEILGLCNAPKFSLLPAGQYNFMFRLSPSDNNDWCGMRAGLLEASLTKFFVMVDQCKFNGKDMVVSSPNKDEITLRLSKYRTFDR